MREQTAGDAVTVDPSFGRFDPQQLAVVRITSTDPSATPPTPTAAANAPRRHRRDASGPRPTDRCRLRGAASGCST